MPNKDLLTQLVLKLDEYLEKLKFLQKYSRKEVLIKIKYSKRQSTFNFKSDLRFKI